MYTLSVGSRVLVVHPRPDGSTVSFTRAELQTVIDRVLTRKERNNGLGRHLRSLASWGYCTKHTFSDRRTGFEIRPSLIHEGKYEVVVFGDFELLLRRLNAPEMARQAHAASRLVREERRRLRALGLLPPKRRRRRPHRALPGENGKMKLHFRNHELAFDDAVRLIARSARHSTDRVRTKLIKTLDERGVGSYRLKSGFVYRVDLKGSFVVDFFDGRVSDVTGSGGVELRTTANNTSLAYRRLRGALKAHFGTKRKEQERAQKAYRSAMRTWRLYTRRTYG